jgi:hypothetical protein
LHFRDTLKALAWTLFKPIGTVIAQIVRKPSEYQVISAAFLGRLAGHIRLQLDLYQFEMEKQVRTVHLCSRINLTCIVSKLFKSSGENRIHCFDPPEACASDAPGR